MKRKFDLSYGRFTWFLFGLLGWAPASAGVTVDDPMVHVRLGWAFSASFPRSSVAELRPGRAGLYGLGVHGGRGTWVVNGRLAILWLDLDPPATARVLGVRAKVRRLGISLEDPDAFAEALQLPVATG